MATSMRQLSPLVLEFTSRLPMGVPLIRINLVMVPVVKHWGRKLVRQGIPLDPNANVSQLILEDSNMVIGSTIPEWYQLLVELATPIPPGNDLSNLAVLFPEQIVPPNRSLLYG